MDMMMTASSPMMIARSARIRREHRPMHFPHIMLLLHPLFSSSSSIDLDCDIFLVICSVDPDQRDREVGADRWDPARECAEFRPIDEHDADASDGDGKCDIGSQLQ